MEFLWTITFGQVLSTAVLAAVIITMYGVVLFRVARYTGRVSDIEKQVHQLKVDVEALTKSLKLSDASRSGL